METNDIKIKELLGNEHAFQKDVPYIVDLTFSKYDFQKNGDQIIGLVFQTLIKFIKY